MSAFCKIQVSGHDRQVVTVGTALWYTGGGEDCAEVVISRLSHPAY